MELIEIKRIFNIEKGTLQSSKNSHGDYPFITASATWKSHKIYSHDAEAIIVAVAASGSLGRTHYVNGKFVASDLCFILTPKDNETYPVDLRFYAQIFQFLRKELVSKTATGTSKLAINKSNFGNFKIPYFVLAEQRSINQKLLKISSKKLELDNKISAQRDLIEQLKSSAFQRFFEKEHGEGISIEDVSVKVQYGYTASANEKGNAKLLRITDIQEGSVDWDSVPFCECPDLEKYRLQKGDILFARTGGTVGKSFLVNDVPNNAIFASYLIRLQTNSKVIPEYVYAFFQSSLYWDQVMGKKSGGAQPNVNGSKLKRLKIPIVSIKEQLRVVKELSALSNKIFQLEMLRRSIVESSETLDQLVISMVFEGKFSHEEIKQIAVATKTVRSREKWFAIKQGIGAVLEGLSQTPFERGEMVIAKYMYLLQEVFKVSFGLQFVRHQFGPYDPDIKRAITASAFGKDKFFKVKGGGEAQVYSLGDNSSQLFKYDSHTLNATRTALGSLLPITGKAKSADIERLATVCKIVQDTGLTELDSVMKEMHDWKKDKFSKEEVSRSLDFIKTNRWDQALIAD